jgi:hypothetical protein
MFVPSLSWQMMIVYMKTKWHRKREGRSSHAPAAASHPGRKKNSFPSTFPVFIPSLACLGKMMHFYLKSGQKVPFFSPPSAGNGMAAG